MKINRELAIGMFIVAGMSNYNTKEVANNKAIQYIAKTLKKKNFPIRNGSSKDKMLASDAHTRFLISKVKNNEKKKQQIIQNGINAVKRLENNIISWDAHQKIAIDSWKKAAESFGENNAITVSELILALLRKEPTVVRFYGFNEKKLQKYRELSANKGTHIFSSSRVASRLLECLDAEIAQHNYRQKNSST